MSILFRPRQGNCLDNQSTPTIHASYGKRNFSPFSGMGQGDMHLMLLAEIVTAVESTGGPRLDVNAKAVSVASRRTPFRDASGKPARSFDWRSTKRDSAHRAHATAGGRRQKWGCHRLRSNDVNSPVVGRQVRNPGEFTRLRATH
ncbi:hypothetical protein BCEP27_30562 [Burkholderia cepacia]